MFNSLPVTVGIQLFMEAQLEFKLQTDETQKFHITHKSEKKNLTKINSHCGKLSI